MTLSRHTPARRRAGNSPWGGVVAAMVLPYRGDGEPDLAAIANLCERSAGHGCDGLFVLGSTGELPLLDERVRRPVIAAAREGCPSDTRLYAGVTSLGIKQTLRHARDAAAEGADAVVVMAPFFPLFTPRELRAYFTAIADGSPVPVTLYHHMALANAIDSDLIVELAAHPNIVALKDTSSDVRRLIDLLGRNDVEGVALLQGREPMLLESLDAGADGCVTAVAGVVPEWHAGLFEAQRTGDTVAARAYQEAITELWRVLKSPAVGRSFYQFVHVLKALLRHRGWLPASNFRHPGFEPDRQLEATMIDRYEQISRDLIADTRFSTAEPTAAAE